MPLPGPTARLRPGRPRSTTSRGAANGPGRSAGTPRSVAPPRVWPVSGWRGRRGSRRSALRNSSTARRSASTASDGATSTRCASDSSSATDAVITCVSPSWIAYARRARSPSTGAVEIRGTSSTSSGRPKPSADVASPPSVIRFHRPPFSFVFFWHGLLAWSSRGARRSGPCLRRARTSGQYPEARGRRSPFGLVLISVVRGGGLNAPVQAREAPQRTRPGPQAGRARSGFGPTTSSARALCARSSTSVPPPRAPLAVVEHDQAVGARDAHGVGARGGGLVGALLR